MTRRPGFIALTGRRSVASAQRDVRLPVRDIAASGNRVAASQRVFIAAEPRVFIAAHRRGVAARFHHSIVARFRTSKKRAVRRYIVLKRIIILEKI